MKSLFSVCFVAMLIACAAPSAVASDSQSATIVGIVTLRTPDGSTFPGEGARVVLACAADGTARTDVADARGAFRFLDVPIDRCSIETDVQGFVAEPVAVLAAAEQVIEIDLRLGVAPLRAGVNVGGAATFQETNLQRQSHRSDAAQRRRELAKGSTR
jgi:hypothetical protein